MDRCLSLTRKSPLLFPLAHPSLIHGWVGERPTTHQTENTMNERHTTPFEAFEDSLRGRKFKAAAEILISHCNGMTLEMITEILTVAYVHGTQLDLTKLTGQLSQRRRRVRNAIESLKAPAPLVTTKKQREFHNTSLNNWY